MCARGAGLGAFGRAARAHTVPTTARSPLSVLMAAHKPSGVRGVRGPCRAHSTQGSGDGGSGRRAAHRWARCGHGSRAPRSACTRAALSTQPTRSAGAGRQATWGSPGEKCGTPRCSPTSLLRWVERRQRQRREPRGECGVHNTRACVHIRHGESGCGQYRRKRSQPAANSRRARVSRRVGVSSKRSYSATEPRSDPVA